MPLSGLRSLSGLREPQEMHRAAVTVGVSMER